LIHPPRCPCPLEPVAAVGDPPGGKNDWDSGGAGPPEGKQEISQQPKQHEDRPEYLFLHGNADLGSSTASNHPMRTRSRSLHNIYNEADPNKTGYTYWRSMLDRGGRRGIQRESSSAGITQI